MPSVIGSSSSTTATDTNPAQEHTTSQQEANDRLAGLIRLVPAQLSQFLQQQHQQGTAAEHQHAQQQTPTRPASSNTNTYQPRSAPSTAANKLHFKTVVDLNSGARAAELSWHVRLQQQPARLAVKRSNRHKTRVSYEAQVALRCVRLGQSRGWEGLELYISGGCCNAAAVTACWVGKAFQPGAAGATGCFAATAALVYTLL